MTRNPINHDANRAELSLAQRNALDRATQIDRRFFKLNPDREHRLRRPAELESLRTILASWPGAAS